MSSQKGHAGRDLASASSTVSRRIKHWLSLVNRRPCFLRLSKIQKHQPLKRILLSALLGLVGCGGSQVPAISNEPTTTAQLRYFRHSATPIQHVVIVIQENRSVDNLFHFLPGANTVSYGKNSKGQSVPLVSVSLTAPYDMDHDHSAYVGDYADGHVDGWNFVGEKCKHGTPRCPSQSIAAYAYVPQHEVQPYYDLAEQYTFGAAMFQSNQGPSFPANQYLVSGTSTIVSGSEFRAAENAFTPQGVATGGCDSPALGLRVPLLVISPYAKRGYISRVPHEFGSILKFTEETFGLGSMGTTDVRADDLSDCFQFHKRHKFEPIPARFGKQYFLQDKSTGLPDDD
jgi:phospholipase C